MSKKIFINFDPIQRGILIIAMRKDVAFLRRLGLMDYSLLLCVERSNPENKNKLSVTSLNSKSLAKKHRFITDKYIYHVAIIDYLQEWNLSKKGERFIKTTFLMKDKVGLSAIEPNQYS